jgi:RNA polymerase sigma factor (sigma-70 family)
MRGETVPADHRSGTIEDPFVAFYRSQYPGAVRLAMALTQWRDGTEDIVQDSFARVQPRFASLERPGGYLRVTVVNMCREAERRRRREHRRLGLVGSDDHAVPEEARELLDVLAALDYRPRAVLVLRYWAGWSEAEIADALGCRPGTVKSVASRALTRLRRELGEDG